MLGSMRAGRELGVQRMRDDEGRADRFSVLGPVRGWRADAEIDLGAPQQRALLALLLVRAGQPVPLTGIVDALWSTGAPARVGGPMHAALIRTLGRAGRQAEAFAVFNDLRGRLVDDLGVDPGPEIAAAHREVLLAQAAAHTIPHPASPQTRAAAGAPTA